MNILRWLKGLLKKKQPEKIRIVIRDGRYIRASVPDHIYCSPKLPVVMQEIACYENALNGDLLRGISTLGWRI